MPDIGVGGIGLTSLQLNDWREEVIVTENYSIYLGSRGRLEKKENILVRPSEQQWQHIHTHTHSHKCLLYL
jgi:hypothetical protein